MRNEQKYATPGERLDAFKAFCKRDCKSCVLLHSGEGELGSVLNCWAYWLALPCEDEKPEPCPFCGGETSPRHLAGGFCVECDCGYTSPFAETEDTAIAAHNRVCRAVRARRKEER